MAPRTASRKYTGVYLRASTQSYYCELPFHGSGSREKRVKFYKNCPSYNLALLVSDVARFYMRDLGSFTFNLSWSVSVIESRCVARSHYESLLNPEEKRRFVQKQTDAMISFFTKFNAGISQVSSPARREVASLERQATDILLNCPPSHRVLDEIVLHKRQALKQKYLEDMIRMRDMMGHTKDTKLMPADEVQKLNQHMLKLKRWISFMESPREELPPDLNSEKLDAFDKEMHDYYLVTALWFLDFDKAGSASQPESASHEVTSPERHETDLPLNGSPFHGEPYTDLPTVLLQDGACSATEEREKVVSEQPMPGDKFHEDEDMLIVDEILASAQLPPKKLPLELTSEKDFENDDFSMELVDASSPSLVQPQVLHGSDIPLDGPLSHGKLDTDLPPHRGEIVLHQDGACSATKERDGACTANEERDQGVWEMHQDIKQKQSHFMHGLRIAMDGCKNPILMQPSQRQKLNKHMHDLNKIISFMELPRAKLPPELSCEELSARLRSMMEFYTDTAGWLLGIYHATPADSCC